MQHEVLLSQKSATFFRERIFTSLQQTNTATKSPSPPPRAPLLPFYSGSGSAKCGSRSRIHCPPMRARSSFSSETCTSIIALHPPQVGPSLPSRAASPLVRFLRNLYLDHRATCSFLLPSRFHSATPQILFLQPPPCVLYSFSRGIAQGAKAHRQAFPLLRFLRGQGAPKLAGGRRGAGGLAGGRTFRPDPATTEDQASRKERK